MKRWIGLAVVLLSAAVMATCGRFHVSGVPLPVSSIRIIPSALTSGTGTQMQVFAFATYIDGSSADVTREVTWGSTNESSAVILLSSIQPGGVLTLTSGSTNITAKLRGVTGQKTLAISPATLVSIAVTPLNPTTGATMPLQFTATGTFSDATTSDVTTSAVWTSGTPTVATVAAGLAVPITGGTTAIRAQVGAIQSPPSTLTVNSITLQSIAITPANSTAHLLSGGTQQLTATGTMSDLSTVDLTTSATWTSSGGIVSVGDLLGIKGLAVAIGLGSVTVTATVGTVSGSTTVFVAL